MATGPVTRNPDIDAETKELVRCGVKELTEQFSTLMLRELKRMMIDYEGLKRGNEVVTQNAKTLLSQALDLHQPIHVRVSFTQIDRPTLLCCRNFVRTT